MASKKGKKAAPKKMSVDSDENGPISVAEEIKKMCYLVEIIEQCGKTAQQHGFWDAHRNRTIELLVKEGGLSKKKATEAANVLADCGVVGDPFIFLGLIQTEISEAMEGCRKDNWTGKDGVYEELADVVIRIFDFICRFGGGMNIRHSADVFRRRMLEKMSFNEGRPYLHGKKF